MAMPKPKLRPFQFTLRSLLLFTLFVALLCSIRVSTGRGYVAAVVAVNLLISGFAGRTVAGTGLGLVLGCVSGCVCAGIGAFTCAFVWGDNFGVRSLGLPRWECVIAISVVATVGSVAGGALGGFMATYRSRR